MGDSVWQGSALAGQATINALLADNARALELFELALTMAERSGQRVFALDMLTALGNVHLASGDDEAALGRFQAAHALAVELANPRWQAWAKHDLGTAFLSMKSLPEALRSFEQAAALVAGLGERWLEAQALVGLAETSELMREDADAHRYALQALEVSRATEDRVLIAKSEYALGTLDGRLRRLTDARQSLRAALSGYVALFGTNHPLVAEARIALAGVDYASGRFRTALDGSLDAERVSVDHVRTALRYLPERQALAFAGRRPRGVDLALSIAADGYLDAAPLAYHLVVRARGVVLDELATRERSSDALDPDGTSLLTAANLARERYANLLVRGADGEVSPEQLATARRAQEMAERQLATSSAGARAERVRLWSRRMCFAPFRTERRSCRSCNTHAVLVPASERRASTPRSSHSRLSLSGLGRPSRDWYRYQVCS